MFVVIKYSLVVQGKDEHREHKLGVLRDGTFVPRKGDRIVLPGNVSRRVRDVTVDIERSTIYVEAVEAE